MLEKVVKSLKIKGFGIKRIGSDLTLPIRKERKKDENKIDMHGIGSSIGTWNPHRML